MTRARFNLVVLSLLLAACGKKKVKIARGRNAPNPAVPAPIGSVETGLASWYGHPYHGRQAADGEIYDMETLVAAHRTLPFNTWVRVKNLSNSKSVDVRIIDRGPFVDGRIIDLSHAAAKAIDLIGPGVTRVKLEVIPAPAGRPIISGSRETPRVTRASTYKPPQMPQPAADSLPAPEPAAMPAQSLPTTPAPAAEPALFGVQVGVFAFRVNAERVQRDMQARYGSARVIARQGLSTTWRVVVGSESSTEEAQALAARIRSTEKVPESFVVRLDP